MVEELFDSVINLQVEEEKKWQEELAQRRHKTKKRSLGNIRFIGELFKLKVSMFLKL